MVDKVTVFGASGFTGSLIVAELQRLNLPFNIAGRDLVKLRGLAAKLQLGADVAQIVADPLKPSTLPQLFKYDTRVLVNCVGPFIRYGEPVVRAAVEAGTHYIDTTGEQPFIMRVFDQYSLPAGLKNCALIPACAVEYALGNWLGAVAAEGLGPLESIFTATYIQQIKSTAGTQLSLWEALAAPGFGWENGRRVRRGVASRVRTFSFPSGSHKAVWSPFGEPITLPLQYGVKNVETYMALSAPLTSSLGLMSPLVPLISKGIGAVARPMLRKPRAPTLAERQQTRWEMVAQAQSQTGKRLVSLTAGDAYGLSAVIIGYAAQKMLSPAFQQKGALGPAQAFEAHAALDYLRDFGVNFEVEML